MPVPKSGENKDDFINRCVPILIDEGKDPDQAAAVCYNIYKNRLKKQNKNMSEYKAVLNKIRTILNMDPIKEETNLEEEIVEKVVKMEEAALEDGTVIYYDGELGIDTAVFQDETMATPVEDGEYVLQNGDKFVITAGVITDYMVLETPEEPAPPAEETMTEDFEKKYNDLKNVVDELKEKLLKFSETEQELKKEIEKLSTEPAVESISQEPQDKRELTDLEKRLNTLEAIRRMRKK